MFDNYLYRSGHSSTFQRHFDGLAREIAEMDLISKSVLEVGSNDGYLLDALVKEGVRAIGIEPSEILVNECKQRKLQVHQGYLNLELCEELLEEHGNFEVVVGNNVFAHIDNIQNAFSLVFKLLGEEGIFIFEVAQFKKIVTDGIFDTIYHEHMSYYTVTGCLKLAQNAGLRIDKVQEIPTHGGSYRFYLRKTSDTKPAADVLEVCEKEELLGLTSADIFEKCAADIEEKRSQVNRLLDSCSDNTMVGYGAPAKLVTLAYQVGLNRFPITYVVDDNELKQGKFIPGLGYEIQSQARVKDYVERSGKDGLEIIVFPWNLSGEVIKKLSVFGSPSKHYLVFFPQVQRVTVR
jgi:SAM-dependent methyltransferase